MVSVPHLPKSPGIQLSGRASAFEELDYSNWADEELARQYLETGNDDLFALLVTRYSQCVFRLAVSVLGPSFAQEAEEVAQETFLTVHRSLKRFRFDCKFSTWLYRIAFNRAIDWRRKPRFRLDHSDESYLAREITPKRNQLHRASDLERGRRVLESVEGLPQPQRTVVYLYYWQDQSVGEIADYLELNPSTVKSHLFRARKTLGKSLRGRI